MSEHLDQEVLQLCKDKHWEAAVITFNQNCKKDDCNLAADYNFSGIALQLAGRFAYLSLVLKDEETEQIYLDFLDWCSSKSFPIKNHQTYSLQSSSS